MPESIEGYLANAYAEASALTEIGQVVTGSASASASSNISYDDAYQIAYQIALETAQQNADNEANILNDHCCLKTFYAEANGSAFVIANNGKKITSSASSTASSTLSYEDAYNIALMNAESIALQTAQNDANLINESFPDLVLLENLSSSNNEYNVQDNTNSYYLKGSNGNYTNMDPTFFSLLKSSSTVSTSCLDKNGNLYIGGSFKNIASINGYTTSNGLQTIFNNIALWDGSSYSKLGYGVNGTVNSIAISPIDGSVYVGGSFTYLGDNLTIANNIAIWRPSTSSWSTLNFTIDGVTYNGVNGIVNSIAISQIDESVYVYVGGNFIYLGDKETSANRIAIWNSNTPSWSTLDFTKNGVTKNGVNAQVKSITIDSKNNVYIGGSFTFLGDGTTSANRIAIWNPKTSLWSTLNFTNREVIYNGVSGNVSTTVNSIVVDTNNAIFIGGNFTYLGDGTTSANRIAIWDPITSLWSTLNFTNNGVTYNGVSGNVNSISIDSNNNVYIGGAFIYLSDNQTSVNYIAKWSSSGSWNTVGKINGYYNGLNSSVNNISINKTNNMIYVCATNNLYQLFTDYININYNEIQLYQLYLNGQSISIYTKNINGKKICNVINPSSSYQNYY